MTKPRRPRKLKLDSEFGEIAFRASYDNLVYIDFDSSLMDSLNLEGMKKLAAWSQRWVAWREGKDG